MPEHIKPEYFVLLIMSVPGAIGGMLAYYRGRSLIGWCILCALFPVFLLVIYFNKPVKEVQGGFKRCGSCNEYIKWRDTACKYCGTEQPARG